jgi:hypothetical protein
MWDDLSFYQRAHNNFVEAAHSASIALILNPAAPRIPQLRKLIDSCRHAPGVDASDFETRFAPRILLEEVNTAIAKANDARKARQLYVTPAFAELMHRLDVPDSAVALAKIPTDPVPLRHDAGRAQQGTVGTIQITPAPRKQKDSVTSVEP